VLPDEGARSHDAYAELVRNLVSHGWEPYQRGPHWWALSLRPSRPPDRPTGRFVTERRLTRGSLVRGGLALAGGSAALAAWPLPTSSAPSAKQDAAILRFGLLVEDLQAAFYADALDRGALSGELLEFARVVGRHERAHAAHIREALGAGAPTAPRFDFGEASAGPTNFARTAIKLEDLGLAAYNGAATSLTAATLADAARIVSVEARHAAWIRDLAGELPAPGAADRAISAREAKAAIDRTGFVR
jgi:hypothetical protein